MSLATFIKFFNMLENLKKVWSGVLTFGVQWPAYVLCRFVAFGVEAMLSPTSKLLFFNIIFVQFARVTFSNVFSGSVLLGVGNLFPTNFEILFFIYRRRRPTHPFVKLSLVCCCFPWDEWNISLVTFIGFFNFIGKPEEVSLWWCVVWFTWLTHRAVPHGVRSLLLTNF